MPYPVFRGVSARHVTSRQVTGQSLETGWRRTAHLPPSAPIAFYLTIRREPHNPAARGRCFIHRIRAEGRVSSGRLAGDGFNRHVQAGTAITLLSSPGSRPIAAGYAWGKSRIMRIEGPRERETTRYPNRPAPVLALRRSCPRWIEGFHVRDEPVPATAERLPMAEEPADRLSARSFHSIKFLV